MGARGAWVACLVACLVGCGDLTDATGDQGRLKFTLATDYEVDGALDEVNVVAGHPQTLSVDLTAKGEDDIPEPDELTYRIEPSVGTSISGVGGIGDQPPDLELLVTQPGRYKIRAISKGKEVDSLSLSFDTSSALELVVKARAPFQSDFVDVSDDEVSKVDEGTQVAFLPIPLDDKGERLAGRIETSAVADPSNRVVPGSDINGVYEQNVWTGSGKIEFYFIDPGTVTVTVTDVVTKAKGAHSFDVQNVGE